MSRTSVLLAHDGSRNSGAVINALAPWLGPQVSVTVLHVSDGKAEAGSAELEAARSALSETGAEVARLDKVSDDAAGAILDVASKLQPDFVAMSTHGRSGVERWVRGSVAERVLRSCPVPVFMVNPITQPEPKISSIVVPLDTSANSAAVLDVMLPLAKAFDASVTLLFVDWEDPTDTPGMAERRRAERQEDVSKWLSGPRERVSSEGLDVELRIARGDVAEEIVKAAQPGQHDLLAMTTHGRSGAGRWLLGSIAEKVLRECRIPVLLQRSSE